jgi:predicted ester cyclase
VVKDVFAGGENVVLRAADHGTHKGVLAGIAPAGRQVTVTQIGIYRLVDNKIAEIWEAADVHGLMEQLRGASGSG